MIGRRAVLSLGVASLALVSPKSASAQRVAADIHIGGWPVAGTIHIGDRYGYPRPRRVVYDRDYPRRIAVRYDRGWKPWKHRNARLVVVYYDRYDDVYYGEYRRGLDEIRVFQDGDRFYRYDDYDYRNDRDGWYDRDGRWNSRDRDRDWDRRDRDRWDRDHDRDRRDRDHDRDGRWDRDDR